MLLDPRNNTKQHKDRSHQDGPQLDMQNVDIIRRSGGSSNDSQQKRQNGVSGDPVHQSWSVTSAPQPPPQPATQYHIHMDIPMILINRLCAVDTPINQLRRKERRKPNEPLQENEYISDQAHLAMDALEPRLGM